jgi:hypothetical protein
MTQAEFLRCIACAFVLLLKCLDSWAAQPAPTEPVVSRNAAHATGEFANVFTEGQTVVVRVPPKATAQPMRWRILEDRGEEVKHGTLDRSPVLNGGALGVGWYRVEFLDDDGRCVEWTTAAVLAKPTFPLRQDSPVCVDSAAAWFAKDDPGRQERFARLAALARVSWVRDRMRWREIQPARDRFAATTTYDTSADIHVASGLKVLQVFHDTPEWAAADSGSRGRYASDLRDVYRFCKAMAIRFKGRVHAWEPWNEANVADFGGHTADEMCSYQKAAYLGFKAGDPNVIVCWNVSTAVPTRLHTNVVLANETWSYFDTYNIHTYDWPDSYERLWEPVLEAASGRPVWVTESDRGIKYVGPEPWCELSPRDEIRKAEFMAQSYASSLFAGASRHFHFILGHYTETRNHVQFGLLRLDQTPRPSYVALAALGRFLAGAVCLGRLNLRAQPHAHVYAFAARPDGAPRNVLVAWAEKPGDWDQRGRMIIPWIVPHVVEVEAVYDYLGRPLGETIPTHLSSAPIFMLLARDQAKRLPLERPPTSTYRPGTPCPVVLHLRMSRSTSVNVEQVPWASDFEHRVESGEDIGLPLYIYNFSDRPVEGMVAVTHIPAGWRLTPANWMVNLAPMERQALPCTFFMSEHTGTKTSDTWIRLRGEFGNAGQPVLAFRLISFPGEGYDRGFSPGL